MHNLMIIVGDAWNDEEIVVEEEREDCNPGWTREIGVREFRETIKQKVLLFNRK